MARMTLKAVHGDGERQRLPLSKRIVDENLSSYRHIPSRARGSDQPQRTQRASSRDQPTLLSRAGAWLREKAGVVLALPLRRAAAGAGAALRRPAQAI